MDDKRTNLHGKQCLWQVFSCSFWDIKARGHLQLKCIKRFCYHNSERRYKWGKRNMLPPSNIYMCCTEETLRLWDLSKGLKHFDNYSGPVLFDLGSLFADLIPLVTTFTLICFPGSSAGKKSTCNAGDPGLIPGLEKSPGEGNGTPLQYSCLENHVDGGAWWAAVHGVTRVGHNWATSLSLSLFNFVHWRR